MMNLRRWLTVVVFTLFAAASPAAAPDDSAEAIVHDFLTQMDRVVSVVATVKDADSANKAAAQLNAIDKEMQKVLNRAAVAPEPSKETGDALQAEMNTRLQAFMAKLNGLKDQLQAAGPEAMQTTSKAMVSLGQSLTALANSLSKAHSQTPPAK